MNISKIQVKNYRLLKDMTIDLERDLSLIIGKNNCGKTSLLSLLNKFIGNKSETNSFSYDDINIDLKKILFNTISEDKIIWDNIETKGISLLIYIEYDDKDDLTNISQLMLDLDPDNKTIVLEFEYEIGLKEINSVRGDFDKYKKEYSNDEQDIEKLFNSFMNKKHKNYFNINKRSILYNYKEKSVDRSVYIDIIKKKVDLKKVITFHCIDARRMATNSDSDRSLSGLSSRYYERTEGRDKESTTITEFENAIDKTDNSLTKIYDNIFENVINKVKRFGGQKENDTIIRVISSISYQQLLKGNTTVVYEDNNTTLPENYNGLGYLNLISMIFEIETLLSDFRRDNNAEQKPADINLLFIEEPEAHTHPQMQYIFINNIKEILRTGSNGSEKKNKINLQTIISTHSSHIVAESEFDDIKYFAKINSLRNKKELLKEIEDEYDNEFKKLNPKAKSEIIDLEKEKLKTIYESKKAIINADSSPEVISKNLKDLEIAYQKENAIIDTETGVNSNHYKFLKQYLTLNRSEVFFADKVILIEGDTERILIPAMMKKIDQEFTDGVPLLSQNISIIEVGAYSQVFDQFIKFIGTKALIITDIDSCIKIEKTNTKGNKIETYDAIDVDNATHTTNGAIKHFFSKELIKIEETEISWLTSLENIERQLKPTDDGWITDSNGNLMITYQVKEKNLDGIEYNARSFEDAFFHINRKMVIDNKKEFNSLKNKNKLDEKVSETNNYVYDSYQLATECVIKKPSFAMDILLNSTEQDDKNFVNWEIPKYIKDGLLWLKQN
jgi:predicted ATP-dependent endonuclease of OLD family